MSVAVAIFDFCCAPCLGRWQEELTHMKQCIIADFEYVYKERRITRRKPEKGVVRLVMIVGWAVLHMYALIVLSIYHAYERNPLHATWWFWSTSFAGVMYVGMCYSDPGFIDKETMLRLTANLKLGVDVVGSDAGRGLLPSAAGTSGVEMQSVRPMARAGEDASESSDDEFAPTAADGTVLDKRSRRAAKEADKEASRATEDAFAAWDDATREEDESSASSAERGDAAAATAKALEVAAAAEQEAAAAAAASAEQVDVIVEVDAARGLGKGRAKIDPKGGPKGGSKGGPKGGATSSTADVVRVDEELGGYEDEGAEHTELKRKLAYNPRIVGYEEEGAEEAAKEAAEAAARRRAAPKGIVDYFSGYCDEADMYLPLRAKFCKKHQAIVAKFDHYCYVLGNSVGELNHGRFYRLVLVQLISIWSGLSLSYRSEIWFTNSLVWTVANIPLLIVNIVSWGVGVPMSILLCIHTFNMLTSSTTYEFVKLEKLEYFEGFYQFSFPFSQGLFGNIGHFCCPSSLRLWPRPPPESEWEDTFWRNRYYSCCG